MAQYPIHSFFIHNGELKPNNDFISSENAGGVYEVIRVSGGVPLFLEEHLDRFFKSASLAQCDIRFSHNEIKIFLYRLIKENNVDEGNLLLSSRNNLKAFFIRHKYPEKEWFNTGVTCGILQAERVNPNAKVFQTTVRQKANELIEKEGYYEVLLVDDNGYITEGSRSNVFFISGSHLFTPPGKEVLLGITRQKTLLLAKQLNYKVNEQEILLNDVQSFDAAFITGTSPGILPLSQIDNFKFDARNKVIQDLRKAYYDLINRNISLYRPPEQY